MPVRVIPGNFKKVRTHCNLCAMQCGFQLLVEPENNQVIGVEGDPDFPTTHGLMCVKGTNSTKQIHHQDRILAPLMRPHPEASFAPVSWSRALAECAEKIKAIQEKYGLDSFAVYGGGALTNETIYLLSKFTRVVLKTRNIDYNGRFCMSSAAAAQNKVFGVDRGMPFPVSDIAKAKFILLVGANIAECLPPMMDVFKEARSKGAVVFLVDPRKTDTMRVADKHLCIEPGTDIEFAKAVLHVMFKEKWVDYSFIETQTENFSQLKKSMELFSLESASQLTGIPVQEIELTARLLFLSETAMILSARGAEQQSKGVDTVISLINLILVAGKIGVPGSGFGTLTGQGNGQGGREHGQKADQLPGYRKIENPKHREEIAKIWQVNPADLPGAGLSAYELLDAIVRKEIKGLFVMGSNPVMSAPQAKEIKKAFKELEFLAVVDFFPSETVDLAQVVLPTTMWAEEMGTTTNLEGRVLLREKAIQAPPEVKPDWRILCELAKHLNHPQGFLFDLIENVFEEFTLATKNGIADYSGITYDKIRKEKGVHWPCVSEEDRGTPRLFLDKKSWHPNKKFVFHDVSYRPIAEKPDCEFPYILTTGRLLHQYLTGNQTHRIPELEVFNKEPKAEIPTEVAAKLSLQSGDLVRLITRRGSVEIKVKVMEGMNSLTVFVPFHWGGEQCINQLTNPALDPVSRMPEFKACAVKIEKI
ncbi:MAG: molybdopterin oxidoreductase family protein [Elusimicrobiota bacterium]